MAIRYSMSIMVVTKKFTFESQQWFHFHIWFFVTLCCKMRQMSLKNVAATFLENVAKVSHKIRHVFYYKGVDIIAKGDSPYKMRKSFQNATFITKCFSTMNKH